jgi:hypothetical protein
MSRRCVDPTTRNPRNAGMFFFMTITVLFKWLTYVLTEQQVRQKEDIPNTVGLSSFFFSGKKVLSSAKTLISV